MPAADVTVTAEFEENPKADGELLSATYISRNGKIGTGTDEVTRDVVEADVKTNFSNSGEVVAGNGNWNRVGLIRFNANADTEDAAPIYRAYLKLTQKSVAKNNPDNGFVVASVTGEYDPTTITYLNVYGEDSIDTATKGIDTENSPIKAITDIKLVGQPTSGSGTNLASVEAGYVHSVDITNYVKSIKQAEGKVYSLAVYKSKRGITFYGAGTDHEPELEITRGVPVTFTVQAAANAETKIENAEIVIKDGAGTVIDTLKTDENGAADTVLLPSTAYTYTVTSTTAYAIKKDGSFTTTADGFDETVSLAANEPDHIVITSPQSTDVAVGSPITFTAKVYDADNRELTNEGVTWSIVNSPENISVSNEEETAGQVSVTSGVVAGEQSVQAAATSKSSVTQTATFNVQTASQATINVVYVDTEGNEFGKASATIDGKYVGSELTVDPTANEYKDLFTEYAQANTGDDEGTTTYYTYNADATTSAALTIAELQDTNTITIKYSTDNKKYYIKEDFSGKGDWGMIGRGSRGSATGASIADGVLTVKTNAGYAATDDPKEASRTKTFDKQYSGKVEISFTAQMTKTTNGHGSGIYLLDNSETPVQFAKVELKYASSGGSNINGTAYNTPSNTDGSKRYHGDTIAIKYIVDFTKGTVEAYANGTKMGETATTTAKNLATLKVIAISSETNMIIDDFAIAKLATE